MQRWWLQRHAQTKWLYTSYTILCQRSSASGEIASDELASGDLTSDDVIFKSAFFRRTKLLMISSSGALSIRCSSSFNLNSFAL